MRLPEALMPEWEAKTAADFELSGIHVWKVHLLAGKGWEEKYFSWLSEEEQKRARRIHFEALRQRFTIAHGAVREILGCYLHQLAAAIEFTTAPSGKPFLMDQSAISAPGLQFNYSHSGGLLILAVSQGYELGIDVEQISSEIDYETIARHFYHPGELSWLQSLAPKHQAEAFYRLWTCKEAALKADGSGLRQSLEAMKIEPSSGEKMRHGWPASCKVGAKTWAIQLFKPDSEYTAALATNLDASAAMLPVIKYFYWQA